MLTSNPRDASEQQGACGDTIDAFYDEVAL